jgi:hypothetical protein
VMVYCLSMSVLLSFISIMSCNWLDSFGKRYEDAASAVVGVPVASCWLRDYMVVHQKQAVIVYHPFLFKLLNGIR